MTIPYTPPGVSVTEVTTPTITPLLAVPGSVCLVGLSSGSIQRTDTVILNGTSPSILPGVPVGSTMSGTAIIQVLDAINPSIAPSGYSSTTDYSFNSSNYTITRQVTTNTLASPANANQAALTLSSGSVPAVGQVVSVGNTTTTVTGNTVTNSNIITGLSTTTGLAVGATITGAGIPGGSLITSIRTDQSYLTFSNVASATASAVSIASATIELGTVLGVVGQVVTLTANLNVTHASASNVTWGTIPDGSTVYVTYTYVPVDYFQPVRLTNMADIQTRFGPAWDQTGSFINSSLSFAAQNAFQNGASQLVIQPFYVLNGSGVPIQATTAQFAAAANWQVVLNGLRDLQGIAAIVPVVGQSMPSCTDSTQLQIFQAVQDYLEYQKQQDEYTIAFLGEDSTGSASEGQDATLIAHALTLTPRYAADVTKQLVLINTSSFAAPNQTGTFNVGGQYMAAAIAGMMASRSVSATLTRQVVSGFSAVSDPRTKDQKNNDAANGMLVVETQGQIVQIRHAITMDNTSVATRELSVVNSKFYVIESVVLTLNSQIIGRVVASQDAPTLINNVVIGTLEALRSANDIGNYDNVSSTNVSLNPTIYNVSFAYQPLFPIDYINVSFSLDLTQQLLTVSSSPANS